MHTISAHLKKLSALLFRRDHVAVSYELHKIPLQLHRTQDTTMSKDVGLLFFFLNKPTQLGHIVLSIYILGTK